MWKQVLFRIIGIITLCGGLFAFYDFGKELLPLFEQFLKKTHDSFQVFTILSSFFLGSWALTWAGLQMSLLRSFSSAWLYYAMLPLTVWLQDIYDVGLISTLDVAFSRVLVYVVIYIVMVRLIFFVYANWFTPLSHDDMRHVALEKADTSLVFELRWAIFSIILIGLLILHPADIGTTIDMVVSSIVHMFNLLR